MVFFFSFFFGFRGLDFRRFRVFKSLLCFCYLFVFFLLFFSSNSRWKHSKKKKIWEYELEKRFRKRVEINWAIAYANFFFLLEKRNERHECRSRYDRIWLAAEQLILNGKAEKAERKSQCTNVARLSVIYLVCVLLQGKSENLSLFPLFLHCKFHCCLFACLFTVYCHCCLCRFCRFCRFPTFAAFAAWPWKKSEHKSPLPAMNTPKSNTPNNNDKMPEKATLPVLTTRIPKYQKQTIKLKNWGENIVKSGRNLFIWNFNCQEQINYFLMSVKLWYYSHNCDVFIHCIHFGLVVCAFRIRVTISAP